MTKMGCRKIDYLILKEGPFQRVTAYILRRLSAQPREKENGMDILELPYHVYSASRFAPDATAKLKPGLSPWRLLSRPSMVRTRKLGGQSSVGFPCPCMQTRELCKAH